MACNGCRRIKEGLKYADSVVAPAHDGIHIASEYGRTNIVELDAELRSWLGTPYRHQGRMKGRGVDCVGLVLEVYKTLGVIPVPLESDSYSYDWWKHSTETDAFDSLKASFNLEKIYDGFLAGDILCFQFGRAEEAHVGILTTNETVIHSVSRLGVIESRMEEKRWKKSLSYAYRFNGSISE